MHLAAASGQEECLKLLIAAGADVNCLDDSMETPLHAAARKNYLNCLRKLISHGAIISAKDIGGSTVELETSTNIRAVLTVVRYLTVKALFFMIC